MELVTLKFTSRKYSKMKKIVLIFCCIFCVGLFCAVAQNSMQIKGSNNIPAYQGAQLPKVFLIGEYSEEFENMSMEYKSNLMKACEYDMDVAFQKWMSMLQEMEAYADQIEYDIKGVKIWMKVFWKNDGSIKHIAYYLKPRSRNTDTEELSAFFSSFMNNYRFPLISKEKYSHYGSAAFPTVPKRAVEK